MNEQEMILACQAGDRQAFRMLFETFQDRVYTLALNFCNDPARAQDITQDVFLKLFHTVGQFQQQASFSTWLHRIVVNTCLNEQRRKQRWVEFSDSQREVVWEGDGQEAGLQRREISQAVRQAIAKMPRELRILLLLRYLEGQSYAQIAATLDYAIGTVSSRLNRAHRLLGEQLWQYRSALI